MNDNEILLEKIKEQIRIWNDYFNEHDCYRDDTIFLDIGDVLGDKSTQSRTGRSNSSTSFSSEFTSTEALDISNDDLPF